jgi:hypothetical protein
LALSQRNIAPFGLMVGVGLHFHAYLNTDSGLRLSVGGFRMERWVIDRPHLKSLYLERNCP